jgi:hypothetical protein
MVMSIYATAGNPSRQPMTICFNSSLRKTICECADR